MSTLWLTEFLLARIGEDETDARETRWRAEGYSVYSYLCLEDGAHIARHDPARVLAECAAKRRIVESAREAIDAARAMADFSMPHDSTRETVERTHYASRGDYAEGVLLDLAAVYAAHADYRPEWVRGEPMTEGKESAVEHRPDESKPATFMRHVGNVYTCICGRDVVAGYPCAGESD